MNLCINCKHYKDNPASPKILSLGLCARKDEIDPVAGDPVYAFCSVERKSYAGTCTAQGIHFVQAQSFPHQDPRPRPVENLTTYGSPMKDGD